MVFLLSLLQHRLQGRCTLVNTDIIDTNSSSSRSQSWAAKFVRYLRILHSNWHTGALVADMVIEGQANSQWNADQFFREVVEKLSRPGSLYSIVDIESKNANNHRLRLHKISDIYQYLSVIELKVRIDEDNGSSQHKDKGNQKRRKQSIDGSCIKYKNAMTIVSVSSGMLPLWVPFCFVWNALLFFVPFTDNGVNDNYVDSLFSLIKKDGLEVNFKTSDRNKGISRALTGITIPSSTIFFLSFIVSPIICVLCIFLSIKPKASLSN